MVKPAAPARAMASKTICANCRCRSSPARGIVLIADERSCPLMRLEHAAVLQFAVSTHHGVRIDFEIDRKPAHGGQLVTSVQCARGNRSAHLVHDLPVHRYASVQVEVKVESRFGSSAHMYQNTSTPVQLSTQEEVSNISRISPPEAGPPELVIRGEVEGSVPATVPLRR